MNWPEDFGRRVWPAVVYKSKRSPRFEVPPSSIWELFAFNRIVSANG